MLLRSSPWVPRYPDGIGVVRSAAARDCVELAARPAKLLPHGDEMLGMRGHGGGAPETRCARAVRRQGPHQVSRIRLSPPQARRWERRRRALLRRCWRRRQRQHQARHFDRRWRACRARRRPTLGLSRRPHAPRRLDRRQCRHAAGSFVGRRRPCKAPPRYAGGSTQKDKHA